uniref:Uncharacterized protein n=1 Tax=Rhizophora mucronata TaxID=61149 RepID=A0A2P2M850_RHIMU
MRGRFFPGLTILRLFPVPSIVVGLLGRTCLRFFLELRLLRWFLVLRLLLRLFRRLGRFDLDAQYYIPGFAANLFLDLLRTATTHSDCHSV